MAKQTFTTGQVLTAAQMTSLQETAMGGGPATAKVASYVLVAADAGKTVAMNAAGATTITVNTGLFAAGDTVFIQNLGAGACTVTAGTATVATAGSLILPQNDAGILYFTATGAAIFYDYIQAGAVSPLTTKGDLYTFSTSDARLGVGANDTVLTADSSTATGLKWAAAAGGGMTLISTTSLTGASTVLSSIPQTYNTLFLVVYGITNATADGIFAIDANASFTSTYSAVIGGTATTNTGNLRISGPTNPLRTDANNVFQITFANYTSTTNYKTFIYSGGYVTSGPTDTAVNGGGYFRSNTAISSIELKNYGGNLSTGTVLLYGVK
jgi:hypothetical protein